MKRYFIYFLLFIAFISVMFTSCKKDEPTPEVTTGVIVRSIMRNGVPVYATIHQVIGSFPMDTVVVTGPSGSVFGLSKNSGNLYDFILDPALEQYSTTPPMPGPFSYKVKFQNGVEKSFANSITDPFLAPSQNIAATKATVNNQQAVVLTWDVVLHAEAYSFTVTAGSTMIYNSDQLFTLPSGENGKINFPLSGFSGYSGQTIEFKVIAYDLINNSDIINSTSWSTTTWVAE
jgi:hypothetical protein